MILDLDGVIWLADEPIAGSPEAVRRLRDAGHRVLFLTNNSNPTVADLVAKLGQMGVGAEASDVATSAQAAAALVEPGDTVLVCGGPGVREALADRGVGQVDEGEPGSVQVGSVQVDAVVVGFHREFDYRRLTAAFRAVIRGARLIGTNDDPTYPTPDGPIPGGGSILAAVATAAGVAPVVAGKPFQPMADLVRARLGGDLGHTVLIGDRPSTDGRMARLLGVPFGLVLSGVTSAGDGPGDPTDDVAPTVVAPDLAAAVQELA